MYKVGTLSPFLFQYSMARHQYNVKIVLLETKAFQRYPICHGLTKKVVHAPARYKTHTITVTPMANSGRNGPLTPQMRPQAPQQCVIQMVDNPPSKRF